MCHCKTGFFIVGANASGKSNFLDVFRFLRDVVTPGGGFQDAVNRRGGVSRIRNLAARHPHTNVVIDVDLNENEKVIWRYRVEFNQDNRGRPILREEKIWKENELLVSRPDENDKDDEARLSQTYLEQTFANREFRGMTDFFQSVSYSQLVPQLVRDPERSVGRLADPYGGDFLEQIAAVSPKSQQTRLSRIEKALKIAVPQLSSLELIRDDKGAPHLRARYQHWRPKGALQNEFDFSDGTLRLMGFLWALQVGNGPLLLEEPELSLHPGVVRHLPQMINRIQRQMKVAARQVLISTHSPELLGDTGIGADEMLLLLTTHEGTEVKVGAAIPDIRQELDAGLTMADVVLPRTEPPEISQLALFPE
ncbi:MAG TPA: ATP-binding protein [Phototrophicaceae bacterium]|nr:ATP-binding protein [Phototrophicaceae bacterium]